jgi:hypothetical protein
VCVCVCVRCTSAGKVALRIVSLDLYTQHLSLQAHFHCHERALVTQFHTSMLPAESLRLSVALGQPLPIGVYAYVFLFALLYLWPVCMSTPADCACSKVFVYAALVVHAVRLHISQCRARVGDAAADHRATCPAH